MSSPAGRLEHPTHRAKCSAVPKPEASGPVSRCVSLRPPLLRAIGGAHWRGLPHFPPPHPVQMTRHATVVDPAFPRGPGPHRPSSVSQPETRCSVTAAPHLQKQSSIAHPLESGRKPSCPNMISQFDVQHIGARSPETRACERAALLHIPELPRTARCVPARRCGSFGGCLLQHTGLLTNPAEEVRTSPDAASGIRWKAMYTPAASRSRSRCCRLASRTGLSNSFQQACPGPHGSARAPPSNLRGLRPFLQTAAAPPTVHSTHPDAHRCTGPCYGSPPARG
mmetsp:Transcript_137861/g.440231  ORF Transcript_137861/g.440231 Transcript_137861/m.440231 type:complete len:281 (+) Transcript_137861:276-1118(+)